MIGQVSVAQKKQFIKWFLTRYQTQKRESTWILNYFQNNENLLQRTHFIEDAKFAPFSFVLSSFCSKEEAFSFYYKIGNKYAVSKDPDFAFRFLQKNLDKEYYIQINFLNKFMNEIYFSILEDNPFSTRNISFDTEIHVQIDEFLNKLIRDFDVNHLKKEIDFALDEKDKKKFLLLTSNLVEKMKKCENKEMFH